MVVTAVVLAILVRRRRPAFGWTLLGALRGGRSCSLLDLARPGERYDRGADARNPAGRLGWGCAFNGSTRTPRALLQMIALAALVFSILVETPTNASRDQSLTNKD